MPNLNPPCIETKAEPQSNESERPWAETVKEIANVIADGMSILMSVKYAPKHLLREGERLENASRRAPESKPPNNLWQTVRNWVRAIIKWFIGSGEGHRSSPDVERRLDALEQRVDTLTDEMRAGFERLHGEITQTRSDLQGEIAQTRSDLQEEIKSTRQDMHRRMDSLSSTMQTANEDLRKDLSLNEKANEHARAQVIESALARWSLDARTWGDLLSLEPERVATELLWDDHQVARAWTGFADFLGIPHDSALQRCDLLALVTLTLTPDEPVAFLVVGEARVRMNGRRLTKVLQHVQDLRKHTDYSVLPCLCASRYSDELLARALAESVIPLEWLRNDQMRCHVDDYDLAARIRAMAR